MTSEIEPEDFTWQTLYEYIERRIAGALKALQFLKEDPRLDNVDEIYTASFERELKMLRWCLPLVSEMQNRESLKDISPIMSLNTIRLRCRLASAKQEFLEFAWVSPVAERRYSLLRLGMNESQESGELRTFEAELMHIVEEVEKLVKEICLGESE